jgi:hypothetical protein
MEKKDKNIFETASKQLPKGGKNPPKQAPVQKRIPRGRSTPPPTTTYRDPEVDAMMKQIRDMSQDLENQMETISKKSGLSYDDLKKAIENPKLFKPADLEALKKKQEDLKQKVWGAVGSMPSKPADKQRENVGGERKAKTLGIRKKWIPMR